ncbi:hypothetical protein GDO81_011535 [Engystomops pustulosus]|uniref:G-protein coupled receptors family 1 profile domain-containing protein n=1 Tax=Engystomops pustulosus TaxID=76066 RepID=A0AAV7BEU9_ENGPU|nr:hypothetical protein GDO81_011535 [Engystomops pustulosus]
MNTNDEKIKNNETFTYFYILPFSGETRSKPFITAFFFLIYVVGVLINSSIITVICLEVQLHKPMYLFICNLSIVDIFYTSVTVPKLLHMLLSGNHIVSSAQCYTQLCFFITAASVEETLLFIMAYDRYVAICDPLHYHQILSKRNCILISFGIWVVAFLNSLLYIKSEESRSKVFSTCSSHIAVISIYYGTCLAELLIPSYSDVLDLSFNIIYTTIVPMTNPIIYSLKNCNVQSAILGLIKKIFLVKSECSDC